MNRYTNKTSKHIKHSVVYFTTKTTVSVEITLQQCYATPSSYSLRAITCTCIHVCVCVRVYYNVNVPTISRWTWSFTLQWNVPVRLQLVPGVHAQPHMKFHLTVVGGGRKRERERENLTQPCPQTTLVRRVREPGIWNMCDVNLQRR